MGATAWIYFTPYDPKPAAALRRLRQEVFAAGAYRKPATVQERLRALGPLPDPYEVHQRTIEQLRQSLAQRDSPETRRLLAEAERLAEEAARREPEHRRLMEALRDGTLHTLPEVRERDARVREALGPVPQRTALRSRKRTAGGIAALLAGAGESGTHSILDITRVGSRPGHAVASPLQRERLLETFGTEQPAHAQVETSALALAEGLQWRAVYFAVYEAGARAEWAFIGSSGD